MAPFDRKAWNRQGRDLAAAGRLEEAAASFRQALALAPAAVESWNNLGIVLRLLGRWDEAVDSFLAALRQQPDRPEIHLNLGLARKGQGDRAGAADSFRAALELRPDFPEALNCLGNLAREDGDLAGAVPFFRRALQLRPAFAEAHYNLGLAVREAGDFDAAERSFRQAIACRPDYAEAHFNLGQLLLATRRFAEGWPEYEWRLRCRDWPGRGPLPRPRWDGTPLAGRRILLLAEQGLGDTIQMLRYAPLVRDRGGTVFLACTPRLLPLLSTAPGIDQLVPFGEPLPDFDVFQYLFTLPGLLGTSPQTIPAPIPYLFANPDLVEAWRSELAGKGTFRVGICWQGSVKNLADRRRSIPLAQFAPLAALPGVELISLQKGDGTEQIGRPDAAFPLRDLGQRLDEGNGAFTDTAAVMKILDLVITVDTAVAHLAGALGVPVWVVLPHVCDWRWQVGREDCPWYPTMRLFRQRLPGDWNEVFSRIAAALVARRAGAGETQ